MSWAARRRFFILLIIGLIVAAFLAVVLISTFSKAPSCSDNVQNEGETGIDCGGPCQYLCTDQQQPPTVLFTTSLSSGNGRNDVIASIENKNATAAAKNVPYQITLYGVGQALLQQVTGTLDLPPGTTVPVYVPGIVSGKQAVTRAFLTIAGPSIQWFSMATDDRIVPVITNITQGGTVSTPRIDAILSNPSVTVLNNVKVVVMVHDKNGDVIAASQTILPVIPAQGQATATFTWNTAFSAVPASIEVLPIIPVP